MEHSTEASRQGNSVGQTQCGCTISILAHGMDDGEYATHQGGHAIMKAAGP